MCIFGENIVWLSNSLKVEIFLKYNCFYSDVYPIQECAQYVRQRYHIEVEGLGSQGFRFKWIRKYCLHTIRNLLKSESSTIRDVPQSGVSAIAFPSSSFVRVQIYFPK